MALLVPVPAVPLWGLVLFLALIAGLLALDLGLFQRRPVALPARVALAWSGAWAGAAALFGLVLARLLGRESAEQFVAGYLVELCLSVDNLFLFIVLFRYFQVPRADQHRVLFWGIIGAIVIRTGFIVVGVGIIAHFHAILYGFGVLLVIAAVRLLRPGGGAPPEPAGNLVVRAFRRVYPVADTAAGPHFFVRTGGRRLATPLFLALLAIETTDILFAIDSLPAVLAITDDAFVALSSNVFAILGLRSLYFAVDRLMGIFRFLRSGLAVVLAFIGLKMLLAPWWKISTGHSLLVIVGTLFLATTLSLLVARPGARDTRTAPP